MRDSYYYVLENYTTLYEGAVSLPDRWRLIGPIIAMSAFVHIRLAGKRAGKCHDRIRQVRQSARQGTERPRAL